MHFSKQNVVQRERDRRGKYEKSAFIPGLSFVYLVTCGGRYCTDSLVPAYFRSAVTYFLCWAGLDPPVM